MVAVAIKAAFLHWVELIGAWRPIYGIFGDEDDKDQSEEQVGFVLNVLSCLQNF